MPKTGRLFLAAALLTAVLLATGAERSTIGGWVTAASAAVMTVAIFVFWVTS
jgi:hypothetical protein